MIAMRCAIVSALAIIGASTFVVPSANAVKAIEELVKECGGLDLEKFEVTDDASALCFGYINGAIYSMEKRQVKENACWFDIPAGTSSTDFPVILMRYLKANPAALKKPTPQSIYAAMNEAFPCGQQPPKQN